MAIDASKLRVSLEEKERWRRTLSVTVPADLVEEERRRAAKKLASRMKLPGFREGKIPASVVEKRYGQTVRQETLDRLINEAYREALQLESLRPISDGTLEDVRYEPEEDLVFAISFDVQPEIELGRLGGFTVERPAAEVGEEEVETVLTRLREQNGVWHPSEGSPEEGDLVQVRIERLEEDDSSDEPREYEFVLGQGEAIPDVEGAIATLSTGESGEFTVTFPDDFPDEERRSESRELRITLQGRKIQELPELDDELARSVGDFESLEELRETVREDLEREAGREARQAVRGRLLDLLIEANPFEVPRSMVDSYVEQVLGDTGDADPEEVERVRSQMRPQAERAVKRALIVDRVAETQGLRATDEEVDGRVQEIAQRNDTSPAKVYAELQKRGRLSAIEREITENK
nr:trigger factor [Gemmatimonadota bacterium]NIR79576.1 trigger factor [Gemmatimonadota bacterium]NIT88267.1 trigger factor [Gemmatimonadota bacterium]NIU32065.1 trigger factor [Gemmatimonadota bacterium]NIU36665.1 trigger factor [Gemmatimonadota bacterium]